MSVRLPAAARFLVLTGIVLTATILVSPARAAAPTIHCPADPPVVRRLELREQWRIDPRDPEAPLIGLAWRPQFLGCATMNVDGPTRPVSTGI